MSADGGSRAGGPYGLKRSLRARSFRSQKKTTISSESGNKQKSRWIPAPERIQLTGIILVIAVMLAAELAALALHLKPGWGFLWWLNLDLFRAMNLAYGKLASHYLLHYYITIPSLLALMVLSVTAFRGRHRFALAILSTAAFVWCGYVAHVWHAAYFAPLDTAGVGLIMEKNFGGWLLMAYVVLASLLGFVVTHVAYWRRFARFALRAVRH